MEWTAYPCSSGGTRRYCWKGRTEKKIDCIWFQIKIKLLSLMVCKSALLLNDGQRDSHVRSAHKELQKHSERYRSSKHVNQQCSL